jgi:multisubunit Na+/H+ antiporter MnhB subunit
MTTSLAFDALLALLLLWSAWQTLATPQLDRAVIMFIVFGLLLTLVWARLQAPDIALAEAALGAGLTGTLLLDALAAFRRPDRSAKQSRVLAAFRRFPALLALLVLAAALLASLTRLPSQAVDLPAAVAGQLGNSGVSHPVTAVLLNFRGYDTLLEVAVLLLALMGILAVGLPAERPLLSRNQLVPTLARFAVPLMVLAAFYLLWAGAHRPGGAFQAAAVLAAAAVLLNLAQVQSRWLPTQRWIRLVASAGLLLFVGIAAALLAGGGLLRYPPAQAGTLILLIESGLTVSLAVNLAAFYLLRAPASDQQADQEERRE